MQLVLSNNRIIAHGENFIALGGVVINTETGARYENATVAECENCPSDIDKVGYEYHAGVFVPCAPFGVGNNNGYFMEVCESCATPRSSGIPIKKGIGLANLSSEVTANALKGAEFTLLWNNASPSSTFASQSVSISNLSNYGFVVICFYALGSYNCDQTGGTCSAIFKTENMLTSLGGVDATSGGAVASTQRIDGDYYKTSPTIIARGVHMMSNKIFFGDGYYLDNGSFDASNSYMVPYKIYGVKI